MPKPLAHNRSKCAPKNPTKRPKTTFPLPLHLALALALAVASPAAPVVPQRPRVSLFHVPAALSHRSRRAHRGRDEVSPSGRSKRRTTDLRLQHADEVGPPEVPYGRCSAVYRSGEASNVVCCPVSSPKQGNSSGGVGT